MAELKTKATNMSIMEFIDGVDDEQKRNDCLQLLKLMSEVTNEEAKMWGDSIIGFGSYHYKYQSGREGDWFLTGFSPRKQNLTIYIMAGFTNFDSLMLKLGKFKTGSSCLYIKKLNDIDMNILKELIYQSIEYVRELYK